METRVLASTGPNTLAQLRRLLLAILLIGVVGTAAELILIGHDEDPWQIVPLVVLGLTLVAGVCVLAARTEQAVVYATRLFRGTMLLLIVSGTAGSVLHYRASMEFKREVDPSLSGFALFSSVLQAKAPPTLAPGTMTLLGLVGFACVFRLSPQDAFRKS